jgi:hypothetical protein
METQMQIAIVGGIFAVIVAITQFVIPAVIHSPDSVVPATPVVVNVTPLITYLPPVAENPVKEISKPIEKSLIFSDYFYDNSGWMTYPDDLVYKIYYNNNTLKFEVFSNIIASSTINSFTVPNDFIVEFDANIESNSDDQLIGIYLRKIDLYNYYDFIINSEGDYRFRKIINGKNTTIIPWTSSSAINKGAATNLIKIKCEGDSFTFYINGKEVNSCIDSTFPRGDLSLAAGIEGDSSGDNIFSFDNFKIWSINN